MTDYIKPELLILIPVLNIIGEIIKQTKINDKFIPLILGIIGIILSCVFVIGTAGFSALNLFAAITQGILCAGTAVYGNQIFKQLKK